MEVNIGEVNSRLSLRSPEEMERIVQEVMARVREVMEHDEQAESERRLSRGATDDKDERYS
jgi:hypothetical protein